MSENCQSRIVYDVGGSVNACNLEDRWRRDSQDITVGHRLADRPTCERLGANVQFDKWPGAAPASRNVGAPRLSPNLNLRIVRR
jgi:hypothetical protein